MTKQWPNKTIIGLTGNIATGKSAILRLAKEHGALTIDADKVVHEILDGDASMQAAIAVAFGSQVRHEDGRINRAALGAIVFSDPSALRDLERMLHPAVHQVVHKQITDSDANIVMIEAIKLLEGALSEICDEIWVTNCSMVRQIERLMICRGMDVETASVRVNAQNPQEAKLARANVIFDTNGTLGETIAQFSEAWEAITHGTEEQPSQPTTIEVEHVPPFVEEPEPEPIEVTVRRARPSDIPAIMLLIHRATGGAVKLKRADLLMSFSERSYLIGQIGAQISTVIGWNTDSTTAACIDQVYVYPLEQAKFTIPPVLAEIEASTKELICEVVMAFLSPDTPEQIRELILVDGFEPRTKESLRRAWQKAVDEMQPAGTEILAKVMRDIRIA